jgi:ABC-2 type transport system ATP-binding protein
MWEMVRKLRKDGVTIILTTHYIEEAEEMADRVGVINNGEIVLVEDKSELMKKLGKKQIQLDLNSPLESVPDTLSDYSLELNAEGYELIYTFDTRGKKTGITLLLKDLAENGITFRDIHTRESTLEEIFVSLVTKKK